METGLRRVTSSQAINCYSVGSGGWEEVGSVFDASVEGGHGQMFFFHTEIAVEWPREDRPQPKLPCFIFRTGRRLDLIFQTIVFALLERDLACTTC